LTRFIGKHTFVRHNLFGIVKEQAVSPVALMLLQMMQPVKRILLEYPRTSFNIVGRPNPFMANVGIVLDELLHSCGCALPCLECHLHGLHACVLTLT
jgi:hypothetical protein